MRYPVFFLCSFLLAFFMPTAQAQHDKTLLKELAEENKKSVEALALYPRETREAILEATTYPEILVKLNNARQKTAAEFRQFIEEFPQSTQQHFYEIARYPGLLPLLTDPGASPADVQAEMQKLPEKERNEVSSIRKNHMSTLLKINALDQTARSAFENMIASYPPRARDAFRQLVQLPEVLEILNEDLRFTILVGDIYREDPAWVIHKTDSLNLAIAREQTEETLQWKEQMEKDPEAQQELQAASKEYALEYGYPVYEEVYEPVTVVYAYPWWFGYPWWYPTPCWQPYPWWHQWGFYHHHNHFTVVYMPSAHFMDWYFYHPRHHHHYSHLSAHFVRHYYGHRHSGTSISMGVRQWHDRNRTIISDNWIKDDGQLPKRMAEYGRFEEKRQTYNKQNPKKPVDQTEFLARNPRNYPALQSSKNEAQSKPRIEPAQRRPAEQPLPRKPETKPAQEKPDVRPPREQPVEKPMREQPALKPDEKAGAYHRQQWEDTKRRENPPKQAPAVRQQPAKEVKPKIQTPKTPAKPKKIEGRKF